MASTERSQKRRKSLYKNKKEHEERSRGKIENIRK